MGARRPSKIPSFVFRQDGCELSYEVEGIIARKSADVKKLAENKASVTVLSTDRKNVLKTVAFAAVW